MYSMVSIDLLILPSSCWLFNLIYSSHHPDSVHGMQQQQQQQVREAFIKKNIFLLTFVNKDFSPPPLIIDEKPLRFGGPVRGVTPPPL